MHTTGSGVDHESKVHAATAAAAVMHACTSYLLQVHVVPKMVTQLDDVCLLCFRVLDLRHVIIVLPHVSRHYCLRYAACGLCQAVTHVQPCPIKQ
jgi:hypothetical protein